MTSTFKKKKLLICLTHETYREMYTKLGEIRMYPKWKNRTKSLQGIDICETEIGSLHDGEYNE